MLKRLRMFLYSSALGAAAIVSAPWWMMRLARSKGHRAGFGERLGRVPQRLRSSARDVRTVWLHAVSVGEVLAATRLVEQLEAARSQSLRVVISTTTPAGQRLARERFGAERVFLFPFDFASAVRAYLRALRPHLIVMMESEVWPRLLHEAEARNIPLAVVNARVSDRSFRRSLRVRALWARVIGGVRLWLAQSELDAKRLIRLGASADRVEVSGNLKFDITTPAESHITSLIRELAGERPVVVAGSVLFGDPPEASRLIVQGRADRDGARRPLLVLAPRKPAEFDLFYSVACEYPTLRATELLAGERRDDVEIVVLDTIGDLASVYSLASVAFIGGSIIARGGHNPLEAAQFGVPVVMGASYENFRGIVEALRANDAIRIVDSERALGESVTALLEDQESARAIGERGRAVFLAQQGATMRSVARLLQLLDAHAAREVSS